MNDANFDDMTLDLINEFLERLVKLEDDMDRIMAILRGDIIEGIAAALDGIHLLTATLPDYMPELAEPLRSIHDMNEIARSKLRSSEVFEWAEVATEEEEPKKE